MMKDLHHRYTSCPLCGCLEAAYYSRTAAGDYVQCPECRLVSVDPIPNSIQMDTRANLWSSVHHRTEIKIQQQYSPEFQAIAYGAYFKQLNLYRSTNRLLDIGCGIGGFLSASKRAGWQEFGIDVSPSVEVARRAGLNAIQGRIEESTYPAGYFDVITLIDVIEHINQLDLIMTRIKILLRPGGGLLIVTPNLSSLNSRLLRQRWGAAEPEDHLMLFSPRTLKNLFTHYNLQLKSLVTYEVNPLEFRKFFMQKKTINSRVKSQVINRQMIGILMRSKSLQSLRKVGNYFINLTSLGERLIALAELPKLN